MQRLNEEANDITQLQRSIIATARSTNSQLHDQLVMKFHLAHFVAVNGKPFNFYENFAKFEKDVHEVNLGSSFLNDTDCREMLQYLTKSIISSNITTPLSDGLVRYCSVHNNGSSSAKTTDEKELYIMKTAHKVVAKFHVMSLEEPDEANAEGLEAGLENSIMKLGLNINRKKREVSRSCFIPNRHG